MLLHVDEASSYEILNGIRSGDLSCKPGWVRLSFHPTMINAEVDFIMDAIELTVHHFNEWMKDYTYDAERPEFSFKWIESKEQSRIEDWFNVSNWG